MSTGEHNLKLAEAAAAEPAPSAAELELAALQAKRAEVAERRRAREENDTQAQLAEETLKLADEEAIEQAELVHGKLGSKIAVVQTRLGAIVLKQSNPLKFKRFQDNGSSEYEALDLLVRPCVVHPSIARFNEIMAELPFTMTRCANQVSVLAGVRVEELKGK